MKKFNFLFFAAAILAGTSFTACSDDDDDYQGNGNDTYYFLPETIKTVGVSEEVGDDMNDLEKFEYDSQRRLVKYSSNGNGKDAAEVTYATDGKPAGVKLSSTSYNGNEDVSNLTFAYKEDSVFVNTTNSYNELSTDTLIITADGRIKKVLEHDNESYVFEFDSRGNINKMTNNESNDDIEVATYSYDSKNGLSRDINSPQWLLHIIDGGLNYFTINNIVGVSSKYEGTDKKETTVVKYTYNDEHYPILYTMIRKTNTGHDIDDGTVTITYKKIAK